MERDLGTAELLLEFRRERESTLFLDAALKTMKELESTAPAPRELSDAAAKIRSWAAGYAELDERELRTLDLPALAHDLRAWVRSARQAAGPRPFRLAGKRRLLAAAAAVLALLLAGGGACVFSASKAARQGLKAEYFRGMGLEELVDTGRLAPIDFTSCYQLSDRLPSDNFSARWTGKLVAPIDAQYQFQFWKDNGVRLYLDGQLLIDQWNDTVNHVKSAAIPLKPGPHDVVIEYYERDGLENLTFSWSINGGTPRVVPASQLRPE